MHPRPRILVIEDDSEIRHLVQDYLRRQGFRVAAGDGAAALTSAEFDLLECFLTRPGRVLSREQLMDWTRGRQSDPLDRTIDVQVSRLRKKIECGTELIKTVRNAGYILTATVPEA